MLALVVFLSGAATMALELAGSRLLAPAFGNSMAVWGALISVVLVALSLGYVAGGRLADRWPSWGALASVLAVAALFTALLPLLAPIATAGAPGRDPRWGALWAAANLFLVPSLALGAVSPIAMRMAATSVERLGRTAGALYGLSTAGSIVGTLATSFFLVPFLGIRTFFQWLALALWCLTLLALVQAMREARPKWKARPSFWIWLAVVSTPLLVGFASALQAPDETVLYEKDSLYHHIVVREAWGVRFLHFDNSWQSALDLTDPDRPVFSYIRQMDVGLLFQPEPSRALFVGLGAGTAPQRYRKLLPQLQAEVVELDPAVVEVARVYFGFREDERLRVAVGDGRQYLRSHPGPYDWVVLDAYYSDSIPFHLTTQEFFQEVREALAPGGIVISNVISALAGPDAAFLAALVRTLETVFPQVYLFPAEPAPPDVRQNVIVVATLDEARLSPEELNARAQVLEIFGAFQGVAPRVGQLVVEVEGVDAAPILTDDRAPVEWLQRIS